MSRWVPPVVTAWAMPNAAYRIVRLSADNDQTIVVESAASAFGRVGAIFLVGRQLAPPNGPGDELLLSSGGVTTTLTLPALTVRLDSAAGLLRGTGPADASLDVRIYVGLDADQPEHETVRTALRRRLDHLPRQSWRRRSGDRGREPADVAVEWWQGGNRVRMHTGLSDVSIWRVHLPRASR